MNQPTNIIFAASSRISPGSLLKAPTTMHHLYELVVMHKLHNTDAFDAHRWGRAPLISLKTNELMFVVARINVEKFSDPVFIVMTESGQLGYCFLLSWERQEITQWQ
jgi:hypothetical protein